MIRVLATLMLLVASLATGAFQGTDTAMEPDPLAGPSKLEQGISQGGEEGEVLPYEPGVLIAMVDTEEEARRIAELYGITLVSVEGTLAKYSTDRDVMELVGLGIENGWPLVEPSYARRFF